MKPRSPPRNFAAIRKSGSSILLGFNEPDKTDQADMTVDQAIALWPRLQDTGLRLGSPAPGKSPAQDGSWLARFMAEAEARHYRVDFICVHWYGDITAPDAVEQLRAFLEAVHYRYRRPVWLTEFSGSNGPWLKLKTPVTLEDNAAFLRQALPMLESLPYLERYAWFELKFKTAPWDQVALINPDTREFTVAGRAYLLNE